MAASRGLLQSRITYKKRCPIARALGVDMTLVSTDLVLIKINRLGFKIN